MYDYHTHSNFSEDSTTEMEELVSTAIRIGIKDIAITDHYDPEYANPTATFELDFERYHKEITRLQKKYAGKINILRGIEIALQKKVLHVCNAAAHNHSYDFIIASFHCAENRELYGGDFFKGRSVEDSYIGFYNYCLYCLKEYKDYSVVGHLNIIDRYSDYIPETSCFADIVEEILKQIIADGKGIEFNTSSFRYGMGDSLTPSLEMLKMYHSLGGEIITTASDSHLPSTLAHEFPHAISILKDVGFKYISRFKDMKVIMEKI